MSFLWLTLSMIVLWYGGAPILIRFSQTMKARPKLTMLDTSALPRALSEFIYSNAGALRDIGFAAEAYLSLPDSAPNIKTYLIMLTRRATGDKAMVTLMVSPQITNRYVEFSTRFASGKSVDTNNTTAPNAFPPLPQETLTKLPQVKELNELYAIHRYIIEQEQGIGSEDESEIYPVGTAEEYLVTQAFERSSEKRVETGLLYRDRLHDEAVYRPTWYGAYYMTWKLLFPFKQWQDHRHNQRAQQVLQAFRASGRSLSSR